MKMGNSSKRKIILIALFGVAVMSMAFVYIREVVEETKLDRIEAEYQESRFETLRLKVKQGKLKLKCFKTEDGDWYAFLPSFCDGTLSDDVELVSSLDKDEVRVEYELNKSEDNYFEYKVSFFEKERGVCVESGMLKVMHSANIPSVYIETESGNLDYINEDKERYEKMKATFFDEDGEKVLKESLGYITGHGNRSFTRDKKPYTIILSQTAPIFGMGSSDKWVLISNVYDPTGVQNVITFDMARNAGMQYVPEFKYIDLYFNSMYHGTYLLVRKIAISEENMNFNNLNMLNRSLNPKIDSELEDRWFLTEHDRGYNLDRNPVDITGGYLLERDYGGKFARERTGFVTELLGDSYVVKDPGTASHEQIEYIEKLVNEFERSVVSGDGSWVNFIDVDSFVNKFIIEEFTQNEGAGATSAFYYKPQDSISKLIYAGPVWDYDTAYATYGAVDRLSYSAIHPYDPTKLYFLLYQDEQFRNIVKERYKTFYSEYVSDTLKKDIEKYATLCTETFQMNAARWGDNDLAYLDEIEKLYSYIDERKAFLDSIWIGDEKLTTVRFKDKEIEWNYSATPGTALIPPRENTPEKWINSETGGRYDGMTPPFREEMYVFEYDDSEEGE